MGRQASVSAWCPKRLLGRTSGRRGSARAAYGRRAGAPGELRCALSFVGGRPRSGPRRRRVRGRGANSAEGQTHGARTTTAATGFGLRRSMVAGGSAGSPGTCQEDLALTYSNRRLRLGRRSSVVLCGGADAERRVRTRTPRYPRRGAGQADRRDRFASRSGDIKGTAVRKPADLQGCPRVEPIPPT